MVLCLYQFKMKNAWYQMNFQVENASCILDPKQSSQSSNGFMLTTELAREIPSELKKELFKHVPVPARGQDVSGGDLASLAIDSAGKWVESILMV